MSLEAPGEYPATTVDTQYASSTQRRSRPSAIIGLVNSTLWTQGLVRPLVKALVDAGERVAIFTDRAELWPSEGDYSIERIGPPSSSGDRARTIAARVAQVRQRHDRVVLDLTQRGIDSELPAILLQCDEVWWLVDSQFADAARRNLSALLRVEPKLGPRIHLVWVLRENQRFAPLRPAALPVADSDFKVVLDDHSAQPSRAARMSIQRLVRHLLGTTVGLALGGGGARGLAHLGVLRELDARGISFDMVAGTSSGALMGLAYAGGWPPEEALVQFQEHLTPPRLLRAFPTGVHWYLWLMFRLDAWDRKLRPYLGDCQLQQLQIPFSTVAVDLISGNQVVRDTGDAVRAVLESANLPIVAKPILRDGMALVDGGVLNNLPTDVLISRGAHFVVGVDVVARLPQTVGGWTPSVGATIMPRLGLVDVLFRLNEVREHGLAAPRRGAVDLMIAPDTSRFQFADFSRAFELAEAGAAAAREAAPQLEQILAARTRRTAVRPI